ncbi:hypothetical protein GCM10028803_08940 [Larkinella knui]|uniref:DUF2157 domain-containing protein n=1 Tax=Larkinella knui TaxID=2025310 RepID=A0A3P1CJF4_9BACT|nr:hypothetical protein [Larkinella knui]RRB13395.1 hypothetical protein EHT87_14045 [Larkinella knui]
MKAYNETWVRNKYLLEQVARWQRQGLLDDGKMQEIREKFPVGFHESNGFIEVGLFVFSIVAVSGSYFLLATLLSKLFDNETFYHFFNIGFGIAVGLLAGHLINSRKHYRSGTDNALVIAAIALVTVGIVGMFPDHWPLWHYCLIILPIVLLGVWYYSDLLLTLAAFGTLVTAIFDYILEFSFGTQLLPFVLMGVSTGLYALARLVENRDELIYWRDNFVLLEWLSLSLLLVSCNYFAVRELNFWMMDKRPAEAPEIAWAGFFWTLTMVVPMALFYLGFRQKERPLLIMSAIGWGLALATWRYFHPMFSLETYLVINGFLLILGAGYLIRYLRVPRNGFTDRPDEDSPTELAGNAGIISTTQAASGNLGPPGGMQFGGGDFGGGGSGSRY